MRQFRTLLRLCFGMLGLVAGTAQVARAQPAEETAAEPAIADFYIGAFGGFGAINHNATIHSTSFGRLELPEEATLRSGSGTGIQAGLLFELPFSRVFSAGIRVGYQTRGGVLNQTYTNLEDVNSADQTRVQAQVLDELDAELGYAQLLPHVKITPSSLPLYFIAGPTILYALSGEHAYTETIVEPTGGTFDANGERGRTISRGSLKTSTITPAATVGIGYDLALSNDVGLLFELQYSSTLADIVTNLTGADEWKTSSVGAAVGIRFGLFSESAPPPVAVRERPVDTNRVGRIRAAAVVDGQLSPDLTISGRTVKATEAYAFLPYLFYTKDSAAIPDRYHRIERRAMREFNFGRIERGSALDVYYHVLNIIGQRMRDNRRADVTITGCSSESEGQDTALAMRRAQAVADYLNEVWRVSRGRMKLVARGLPANPSISGVDPRESDRENQRVEFASEDYAVLAPVQLPDTSLLAPAGIVRFFPPTVDTASTDSWALNVMIGDSLIENVETGYGPPPTEIDFAIASSTDLSFESPTPVTGRLVFRDTLYQERAAYISDTVTIRQQGAIAEEKTIVEGRAVDTYTLLLYSFDSDAILDFTRQATILMASDVTPQSRVSVVGHTDRIGLPYYNQQLSERRAQIASQNLGMPGIEPAEVRGLGERRLLYDNSLPEGRYYCRTVTVTIETPIDATVSEQVP